MERTFPARLAVAVFGLLMIRVLVPGFFDYSPDLDYTQMVSEGAVFNTSVWLACTAVSAVLLASRFEPSMQLLRASNPFFLALVGLACASLAWSIDFGASIARLSHLVTLVLCCAAVVATAWHPQRLQSVARPVLTLLLAGSLLFGLLDPDLAIEGPTPLDPKTYWHGLAGQKNGLGALASFGVIFWFHGWAAREVRLRSALAWGGISAACLVLSRSSTSLMATVLVCYFQLLIVRSSRMSRRYMPYLIGVFVVLTLGYLLAVLKLFPGADALLAPITALSGKDTSFTGRTEIWAIIQQHIKLNPVLGSGYGGYWAGPKPSSPSFFFLYTLYFYPSEAHNGYLDVINDLGYVGLCALLGYLALFTRQSSAFLKVNHSQAGLYIAILFQQLLTNLSESHWLTISTDFMIFTLATCCLAADLRVYRRVAAAQP